MRFLILVTLLAITSCSTSFTGSAHLTPGQCKAKCDEWGMEMDGMIAMGEYSDACVCAKKGKKVQSSNFSGGGAVGVVMQMIEEQQAATASARP
ncbi:MAG: hypothetical protein ACLGG0_01605 [Bacteriovoracia bacterium]